jgi:multidrug efflux pump subunit AcrB
VKPIIAWFAENGVAANILMVFIVVAGIASIPRIKKEVFPELDTEMVTITAVYPGATPEDVEEGVSIRLEEAVQGLEGVDRVRSRSAEGVSVVTIELIEGTDEQEALDDVKSRVDALDTLPEDVEEPVITTAGGQRQVINVSISGDVDERTLRVLGERVRDEIAALDGITLVELVAVRPFEISIEVSEDALRRYDLSFDDVAAAIRRSSLDLPGGSIKTTGGDILLRTKGQAYVGDDFRDLILLTTPDGTRVKLGDVATVVDGFEETDQSSRFNGKPMAMVEVFRVGDQSALEVADAVKAYVEDARLRMPAGVEVTVWQDDSRVLRSRMSLLFRNGAAGLGLLFVVLALFLRFRLAFWTAAGIFISFTGALALMPILGVSINLISLFAFIIVLGIVVDDAIVVGENIYRRQRSGMPGMPGAILGAQEVSTPVIFAVLTTVAAFVPLMFVPGTRGQIFGVIPLIVIPVLLFSLVESQLILPHHVSHGGGKDKGLRVTPAAVWQRFQDGFASRLEGFVAHAYAPSLERVLRWRYAVSASFVALALITIALVAGGWIRFTFFPPVESDTISASLTMPEGTPIDVTADAVARIEGAALELRAELDRDLSEGGVSVMSHILAAAGDQPYAGSRTRAGRESGGGTAAHLGEVAIELAPSEFRTVSSRELASMWRERTGLIPDAVELSFSSSLFMSGDAVDVQLAAQSVDDLRSAADEIKARLAAIDGVFEISDSYRSGKNELRLTLKPGGEALGVTVSDLARQVRQGFYGEEVQTIPRGRDDVKVMVRYPEDERRSLADLETMRVRLPDGRAIPLSAVADVVYGQSYSSIVRADRMRTVNVTADVDIARANANEVNGELRATILPEVLSHYPGMTYTFEGEQRQQSETLGGLLRGFLIALVAIYALMAIPFRSYMQPLIIMSAIPFGLIGAIWGHVILGMNLSMLSGFGIVALTGVVVNDNLVLVNYINQRRREGMALEDAIRAAGMARFRPIILTSLTTFAGLLPMMLEKSVQAQFLIPMAVSLAFGVMFATLISLVFVPAAYLIQQDFMNGVKRLFGAESGSAEAAAESA